MIPFDLAEQKMTPEPRFEPNEIRIDRSRCGNGFAFQSISTSFVQLQNNTRKMGNDKNNNDNKFLDKDVIITLTGAADSS